MGLFRVERRTSLNNPSIPLSSDGVLTVLGTGMTTDSGVNVSEMTALKLAVIWRCVSLIAGTIAGLPIHVYALDAEGAKARIEAPLLTQEPYPGMTPYELWETVLIHLLLWGNAYLLKVPNELGDRIVRLLPIPPWKVSVYRKNQGVAASDLWSTQDPGPKQYRIIDSGVQTPPLTDDEIMHIPGLGYDGVRGLGPIAHLRQAIGMGIAAEEFGARLFGSGSLIGGVLTTDQKLTEEQADKLKGRWRERISGLARAHEVAILDSGAKFTPIAVPPEDAQFIQSRMFTVTDIARFFGCPPHLVGDVEKSTSWGTGIAEQSLGFVRYTLANWIRRIEQRIAMHLLPPGQVAEFYVNDLLRGDTAARYSAYSIARHDGWMSPNEIRVQEGMPKGPPELDEYATVAALSPATPLMFGGKEPHGA